MVTSSVLWFESYPQLLVLLGYKECIYTCWQLSSNQSYYRQIVVVVFFFWGGGVLAVIRVS